MSIIPTRRNPPRMALRWKLVPTLRHKQCADTTLCGVYIGNGCRKCPKCKTVQPVTTKRKRSDTPAKSRKKKTPQADGNPNTVYRTGDRVKVFWERYKRWTWGHVSAVYNDARRRYSVKVLGLRDDSVSTTWGTWHLQYVNSTHLKRRLTDDSLADSGTRADVFYKELDQVKSEAPPAPLFHTTEASMCYPTCACIPCLSKYFDGVYSGPKTMAPSLKNLKKGLVIRTIQSNYNTLCEVVEITPCRNPKYSSAMIRNIEVDDKNFGSQNRLTATDKWYHYTIHFEDNGKHSYFHDTTAHFQERIYTLCDEADKICNQDMNNRANNKNPASDAFDYDMNNFTYRIELSVYTTV